MAVWGSLWKFALYNLHLNPRRLKVLITSFTGEETAEGKWLSQGHPDGKALGFSILVLGNPRPGWFLLCDSYPLGGSEKSQVHFPSGEVGDSAGFLLVQFAHLGPGPGYTVGGWFPASLGGSGPLTPRGLGQGNLALRPNHLLLNLRAGREGWAEGRAGLHPLSVFTFWTFIVSLSLRGKYIP